VKVGEAVTDTVAEGDLDMEGDPEGDRLPELPAEAELDAEREAMEGVGNKEPPEASAEGLACSEAAAEVVGQEAVGEPVGGVGPEEGEAVPVPHWLGEMDKEALVDMLMLAVAVMHTVLLPL
jgi:hypothetical protein